MFDQVTDEDILDRQRNPGRFKNDIRSNAACLVPRHRCSAIALETGGQVAAAEAPLSQFFRPEEMRHWIVRNKDKNPLAKGNHRLPCCMCMVHCCFNMLRWYTKRTFSLQLHEVTAKLKSAEIDHGTFPNKVTSRTCCNACQPIYYCFTQTI